MAEPSSWLLLLDSLGVGAALAEDLRAAGHQVVTALAAENFQASPRGSAEPYRLRPGLGEDFLQLVRDLMAQEALPRHIVHLWCLPPVAAGDAAASLEASLEQLARGEELSFYSLLKLGRALAAEAPEAELELVVVSSGVHRLDARDTIEPVKSLLLGPCKVIPQELTGVRGRSLDLDQPEQWLQPGRRRQLLAELQRTDADAIVAWRGGQRWVPSFEPLALPAPAPAQLPLRRGGCYLITGGLGGVGLVLARYLAAEYGARLVLTGRSELPPRQSWSYLLAEASGSPQAERIRRVQELEGLGAEVMVAGADVADASQMAAMLAQAEARFGTLHGVIHAAGLPGGSVIQLKMRDSAATVLAPKVAGTVVLDRLLAGCQLDFLVLCSSLNTLFGGFGQIDYCAANCFLDAYAQQRAEPGVITLNWDTWREVGMAVEADLSPALSAVHERAMAQAIDPAEGVEVLRRALASGLPQLVVSTYELHEREREAQELQALALGGALTPAAAGGHLVDRALVT